MLSRLSGASGPEQAESLDMVNVNRGTFLLFRIRSVIH